MRGFFMWIRALFRSPAEVGSEMLTVPSGRTRVNGRRVRVSSFELDLRPVTNSDFAAFLKANDEEPPPWMFRPAFRDPDQPVVGVGLEQARRFARWVGKRLPTEREWVRAARGDDGRLYPWGDCDPDVNRAHFGCGRRGAPAVVDDAKGRRFGAAPFGHRDLVGNVWEWCSGGALRGGFWGSKDVGIDDRLIGPTELISGGVGFRCAR